MDIARWYTLLLWQNNIKIEVLPWGITVHVRALFQCIKETTLNINPLKQQKDETSKTDH